MGKLSIGHSEFVCSRESDSALNAVKVNVVVLQEQPDSRIEERDGQLTRGLCSFVAAAVSRTAG